MVYALAFWVAVGFDHGWLTMIGLFAVTFVAAIIWSGIATAFSLKIIGVGENPIFWVIGTILLIPIGILMANNVTWFGLTS